MPYVAVGETQVKARDAQGELKDIEWDGMHYLYVPQNLVLEVTGTGRLGALVVAFERD